MTNTLITFLSPLAGATRKPDPVPPAPRLAHLEGARIALVANGFTSTGHLHAALREQLEQSGVHVTTIAKKYWRPLAPETIRTTALDVDAVVSGVCTTPPSTTWGVIDSVAFERIGIPTVTLIAEYYLPLARETAGGEGMDALRVATLPYPIEDLPAATVRSLADGVLPLVIAGITLAADGDDR